MLRGECVSSQNQLAGGRSNIGFKLRGDGVDAAAVLIGGHGALQRLDLRSGRIVTFLENST